HRPGLTVFRLRAACNTRSETDAQGSGAGMRTHSVEDGIEALLTRSARARFVLIGEASHGTHEFYELRAELTKRLIVEHGFAAVAAEADWPDAYRVNGYVRGRGADPDADEALAGFRRFPTWMWRNTVVLE